MPRRVEDLLATAGQDRTLTLTLQDGETVTLAMRFHRAEPDPGKKPRTWYTTDFSSLDHRRGGCERCNGWHHRESGEIGCSSGIIPVALRLHRERDGQWAPIADGEPWTRIAAACSCVYGAWRHQRQTLPFVDRLPSVPIGLSAGDWTRLYHRAAPVKRGGPWLNYLQAAEALGLRISFSPPRRALAAAETEDLPF